MAGDSDAPQNTAASLSCAQCGKPAHLQCPKCVELKLPREGAAFCTQDCFKASWSTHKSVHSKARLASAGSGAPGESNGNGGSEGWLYCVRKGQSRTPKLPHFDWTGSLRPYPISPKRFVPAHIELPDWAVDGIPKIEPNSDLQHHVEIAREVLDAAARVIRPGVTTDEIDRVAHEATIKAGAYPSPLNYHFFPKSCCTELEDGDIVNVDITVYYKGVHGDLNETYFVGNVDEASRHLVQRTYECLEKAISLVIVEVFIVKCSLTQAENKAVGVMKAGQTFTIEPMINAGVWRDRMWPDGWTAVTADGKRSAQFEHTLLVTETGVEVLTARLPSSPKMFPWLQVFFLPPPTLSLKYSIKSHIRCNTPFCSASMAGDSNASRRFTAYLSCARCGKPAHLQCPKCMDLKLPRQGAAFCHKSVHSKERLASARSGGPGDQSIGNGLKEGWLYCVRKGQSPTPTMPHFDWNRSLRPCRISPKRFVPAHTELPDWAVDGIPKIEPNSDLQHVVEIKTPEQIERMREACFLS
ncbi:Microtubule-associated protein 1A [Turnera subulata]|uniref:Microtubule-associated protein 1A n=1 Tax=Turnera subulata TaxID=218843 RepID=A0A9Q0FEK2_9ROSI|nr:Microtubule-associated protein 1A [Turnera subulata]